MNPFLVLCNLLFCNQLAPVMDNALTTLLFFMQGPTPKPQKEERVIPQSTRVVLPKASPESKPEEKPIVSREENQSSGQEGVPVKTSASAEHEPAGSTQNEQAPSKGTEDVSKVGATPEKSMTENKPEEEKKGVVEEKAASNQKETTGPESSENTSEKITEDFITIRSARKIGRRGPFFSAEGDVRFTFKNYDITADKIDGNFDTKIFTLKGDALLFDEDMRVHGDEISINLNNNSFRYKDCSAELSADFLGEDFLESLFVKSITGGGTEKELDAEICNVTTCSEKHPHYELRSKTTKVVKDKYAILRDTELYILGRRIIRVPYLYIPLSKQDNRYIPEFGYTKQEGYFMKSRYAIPIKEDNYVDLRLDLFSELQPQSVFAESMDPSPGFGVGADYHYSFGEVAEGTLTGYTIPYDQNVIGTLKHKQKLGECTFNTDTSYSQFDRFTAPGTIIFKTDTSFLIPQKQATTRLSYTRNANNNLTTQFSQDTISLTDQRRWSSLFNTSLNVKLNNNVTDDRLEEIFQVDFRATQDFKKALAELTYINTVPIAIIQPVFRRPITDRTPQLSVRTDTVRLFQDYKSQPLKDFPLSVEASVGRFYDFRSIENVGIVRTFFKGNSKTNLKYSKSTFDWDVTFKQGFYSDNTAQYIIDGSTGYKYSLGRDTSFDLRYSYLGYEGFTPLTIDNVGKNNVLSMGLSVRPFEPILLSAQTGYDFIQACRRLPDAVDTRRTGWQPLTMRAQWNPIEGLDMRSDIIYIPVRKSNPWGDWTTRTDWDTGKGKFSLLFRYNFNNEAFFASRDEDGRGGFPGHINFIAESAQLGKFKLSALVNYNGYIDQVDQTQFSLIYDMHCADAIAYFANRQTGFRSGPEFGLYLRLKAFPYTAPVFATGTLGEPQGIGLNYR